jgi:hypothetical protein
MGRHQRHQSSATPSKANTMQCARLHCGVWELQRRQVDRQHEAAMNELLSIYIPFRSKRAPLLQGRAVEIMDQRQKASESKT